MTRKIRRRYIMEGFDTMPPGDYPATCTVTVASYGTIDVIVRPVTAFNPPVPTRRVAARRHITTNVRPAAGPNPYEHIK